MELIWRWLAIGAVAGVIVGGAIGLIWERLDGTTPAWPLLLGLGFMIGAVIGGAWGLALLDKQPYRLVEWAPLHAETVLRHATRTYIDAGWNITDGSDVRVVFERQRGPNIGLLILLVIAGIIPGVMYWFTGNRRQTTAVSALAVPDGCDVEIVVNERGDAGQAGAISFFNSLHDLVAQDPADRARAA